MNMSDLPAVNAILNGVSAVFITSGILFIRSGRKIAHRNCMISALIASILFLISYITYHSYVAYYLHQGPTRFLEPAWFRPIYLTILITHTFRAIVVVPMVIMTVNRARKARFEAHKKIARWTWPIWMYVSVTGVLIYFLLYQIFPQHVAK